MTRIGDGDPSRTRSTAELKVMATTAVSMYRTSFQSESRFAFGYKGGVVGRSVVARTLYDGLTLTVGGGEVDDDYFRPDFESIPRHVPDEWIAELRSIRSKKEVPGELDDFYEQE